MWGPGDTQLVERDRRRARAGRLALVGSGTALIDTTYLDNAVDALVAAARPRRPPPVAARTSCSNGEPRPVAEILTAICRAAGVPGPRRHVPYRLAWAAGAAVDTWWGARRREEDPPITRFLAEQLATAHWFDQRRTRDALGWVPRWGSTRASSGWRPSTGNPAQADPRR